MNAIIDLLKGLLNSGVAGAAATGALARLIAELEGLKPKNELEAAALKAILSVLEDHGAEGLQAALGEVSSLLEGKTPSTDDLLLLSPLARSDFVAALEMHEAATKKSTSAFLAGLSDALGHVVVAIVGIALG